MGSKGSRPARVPVAWGAQNPGTPGKKT